MSNYLLVSEIEKRNHIIFAKDRTGKEFRLKVEDPWKQFLCYIPERTEIYVNDVNSVINHDNFLIIDPHFLIPVTSVVKSMSCPRKLYVNSKGAEDPSTKENLFRMMQGNALHDVFSLKIITKKLGIQQIIEQVIKDQMSQLITIGVDVDHIEKYLASNASVFQRLNLEGKTEIDVQNWVYGIHGKFDALIRQNILELKSSKIPTQNKPWPDHDAQISIYTEMMKPRGIYNGKVLYIRDNKMSFSNPLGGKKIDWIIARNYSYLIQSNLYVPPVLRGKDATKCQYCFVKTGCYDLCAGEKTQRDCTKCIHNIVCDKSTWSITIGEYIHTFNTALYFEEKEEIKSQYAMSKVGVNRSYLDNLIHRGYALETETKLNEVYIDGRIETVFSHSNQMIRFRKSDFVRAYFDFHSDVTMFHNCIIKRITGDRIVLLTRNYLPDKISIVSSNSSLSARKGRQAIYHLIQSKSKLLNLIQNSITNNIHLKQLSYHELKFPPIKKYNDKQRHAISFAISTPDFFLIQGPAGTGKTTVIVEILNQLYHSGKRILVTAYTNLAIDNIGLKLKKTDLPFIRIGRPHVIHPDLEEFNIINQAESYAIALEEGLPAIILSTTSNIAHDQYADLYFDFIIMDEAGQLTEPESLKALIKGERAILVGDHKQLQPIVISNEAKKNNLQVSLFERLHSSSTGRFIQLTDQYRMNEQILHFPNNKFYDGNLKSALDDIANQILPDINGTLVDNTPYQVFEIINDKRNQFLQINKEEKTVIILIIKELLDSNINPRDIGIITPFRAQVAELRESIQNIQIDTVDRFQGSEKEIIIFSSITTLDIPILSDPRRLNVALTRAKKKMIVIMTNPHPDGKSLMNQLHKDAVKRKVIQTIPQKMLMKIKNQVQKHMQYIIDDESEIDDLIYPVINTGQYNIFYSTMILVECEIDGVCIICYQDVEYGIECPNCVYYYHKEHLFTWLKQFQYCPVCKQNMQIVEY